MPSVFVIKSRGLDPEGHLLKGEDYIQKMQVEKTSDKGLRSLHGVQQGRTRNLGSPSFCGLFFFTLMYFSAEESEENSRRDVHWF